MICDVLDLLFGTVSLAILIGYFLYKQIEKYFISKNPFSRFSNKIKTNIKIK